MSQPDTNPYQAPEAPIANPVASVRIGRRIALFAALLVVALDTLSFGSGFLMMRWDFFGDTIEQAVENVRVLRRAAVLTAHYLLYLLFLRRVSRRRALNVALLFAAFQLLVLMWNVTFWRVPPAELFDWSIARYALAAVAALATVQIIERTTARPRNVS